MAVTYRSVNMSPGTQHSVQAGDTVSNTTTATAFATTYTIPANWFTVGRGIAVEAMGTHANNGAGTDSLTLALKFGSTTICTAASPVLTNLVARMWDSRFLVICNSTGATGTVEGLGLANFNLTATVGNHCEAKNTAAVTIDTTATNQVNLVVTWSAADAANTITMRVFRVTIFGDN